MIVKIWCLAIATIICASGVAKKGFTNEICKPAIFIITVILVLL